MEEKWNSRTEILLGKDKLNKLEKSKVIIYGIGGVGSFAVEALVRAGIGHVVLVDNDTISISNLNRQIHSNITNVGKNKVDEMKKRILEINPDIIVDTYIPKKLKSDEEELIDDSFSYIIDAVDTVTTKIKLVEKANEVKVPIICAMGARKQIRPY